MLENMGSLALRVHYLIMVGLVTLSSETNTLTSRRAIAKKFYYDIVCGSQLSSNVSMFYLFRLSYKHCAD